MIQDGETPAVAVAEDKTTQQQQPSADHQADEPTLSHRPHAHITLAEGSKADGDGHSEGVASGAASPGGGLRNSKGWDGKLRLPKRDATPPANDDDDDDDDENDDDKDNQSPPVSVAPGGEEEKKAGVVLANPEALSDPEYSDDDNVVPGDVISADEDLLNEEDPDTDEIFATHSRIHSLDALRLERFKRVQKICLRQNSIQSLSSGLDAVADTLQELDLYDNLVSHMRGVEKLPNLTSLDLSFNKIKHIKHLAPLTKLVDLYLVANKIGSLDGLDEAAAAAGKTLRMIELGSNRIRSIAPLGGFGFPALEELWLAKNKITSLDGLAGLPKLRLLSVQSNRIRDLSPLKDVPTLEELYVSHNALTSLTSLAGKPEAAADDANKADTEDAATPTTLPLLRVLDISNNQVTSFSGTEHLSALEEVWASYNRVVDFDDVERCLRDKAHLDTVYLEGNPLQLRGPALYRNKVRLALPQVTQIDATYVRET
ncbi:protein phosphatase regulatory subunit Sds22 [Sporothrix curviconia]|uniref:Protein phosphatase regulatory subunit Sds22 n=1 Tax=Sporothrix curviconia TaxID=1260050 RepID=A0ABP0CTJ3_9PEZI